MFSLVCKQGTHKVYHDQWVGNEHFQTWVESMNSLNENVKMCNMKEKLSQHSFVISRHFTQLFSSPVSRL